MGTTGLLKRPTGVYLIAVLFLLAPIGNILISFAGSGIENWYDPGVLVPFMSTIPAWDWLWLGLLFVTGLLLFFPHKLSWSLAILSLLLVLGVNAYRLSYADTNSIDPAFLKVFSVLAIVCTLSVLVIALYFRFPYLDRRSNWLLDDERYDYKTDAQIDSLKCVTNSISYTGCRLEMSEPHDYKNGDEVLLKFPEISKFEVRAEVVASEQKILRLEFIEVSNDYRQDLSRWLKGRSS